MCVCVGDGWGGMGGGDLKPPSPVTLLCKSQL